MQRPVSVSGDPAGRCQPMSGSQRHRCPRPLTKPRQDKSAAGRRIDGDRGNRKRRVFDTVSTMGLSTGDEIRPDQPRRNSPVSATAASAQSACMAFLLPSACLAAGASLTGCRRYTPAAYQFQFVTAADGHSAIRDLAPLVSVTSTVNWKRAATTAGYLAFVCAITEDAWRIDDQHAEMNFRLQARVASARGT